MATPLSLLPLLLLLGASPAAGAEPAAVVCRTQWQAEENGAAPAHVYNAPIVGAQLAWRPVAASPAAAHPKAEVQTAYELEIVEGASTHWSTGKVESATQTLAVPAAAKLEPDKTYAWRVRVWLSGSPATPSAWGSAAFDTAPAAAVFPGANKWIGGGGQMRAKPLPLPAGKVARARAFVTGMGAFYLFVNGEQVGENVMDPPQTVYSKTILFSTFDVTSLLKAGGANHVGALLGNYKWGYTDQVKARATKIPLRSPLTHSFDRSFVPMPNG